MITIDRKYAESLEFHQRMGLIGITNDRIKEVVPDLPLTLGEKIYIRYFELVRIIRDHRGPGEWIQDEIIEKGKLLVKYPGLRPFGY